jgi:superfamily II DNA or RNA helicase
MLSLEYSDGTLVVRGDEPERDAVVALGVPDVRHDGRVNAVRAPAYRYSWLVRALVERGLDFEDRARGYDELVPGAPRVAKEPRDYQLAAVAAWRENGRRGVVVLPTGAGKTFTAVLAIKDRPRSTLVITPTIDLLHQWLGVLEDGLGLQVGAVGGGAHDVRPVTVTTYESAQIHAERLGNRFGLVVWDEVHHLPSERNSLAARLTLAPYRLGLTATPAREDSGELLLDDLIGPVVFRREVTELAGNVLAPYDVVRRLVALSPDERARYETARALYRGFIASRGIRLGGPGGWRRFLEAAGRDKEGRAALAAWREQRRVALATPRKLEVLDGLLRDHARDRTIVFTDENEAAYEVSRRFLVPAITHETKPRERRSLLLGFADGTFPVLATSRVLNEGVDVPAASVGVVLSGSATVREHVQRLGRLLRPYEGKRAVLYEVVAEGTIEERASAARRRHTAYDLATTVKPC